MGSGIPSFEGIANNTKNSDSFRSLCVLTFDAFLRFSFVHTSLACFTARFADVFLFSFLYYFSSLPRFFFFGSIVIASTRRALTLEQSVSSAGKKMDSVAQYLKKILEIPREVAELEEMLQELGPLNPHLDQLPPFGADEVLWSLYLKASKIDQLCYELGRGTAIAGAEGHQRGSEREEEDRESGNLALKGSSILQATVLPAKEAVDRAEGYLFSIVEHSISLCTSHPSLVVAAVAIIEEEEVNDAERENNADNPAPKRYRDRFTNTLRVSMPFPRLIDSDALVCVNFSVDWSC